ncbi:MAG TPA: DUF998 domain-containing protein [Saprospiraceae bacterium]|nr:DUF998 domain-containing protein [Saprospiraceae bacterium]
MLAYLSLGSGFLSLLSLLILHFVSPEFKPSWRMISEYALGKHKWLITSFFVFWSLSTFFLALLLWNQVGGIWARIALILLVVSGIGEFMGGAFDVKHKLHGLAFALGVPALPVAALVLSYQLVRQDAWAIHKSSILYSAHSTWISLVLMAVTMIVMISGFKKAGIPMGPDIEPPDSVPAGVIAVSGYANRILVFCYILWLLVIAKIFTTQ